MPRDIPINLRLSEEEDLKLRKLCEGTGLDRSKAIRRLILNAYDYAFASGSNGFNPIKTDRQERAWRKIADRLYDQAINGSIEEAVEAASIIFDLEGITREQLHEYIPKARIKALEARVKAEVQS